MNRLAQNFSISHMRTVSSQIWCTQESLLVGQVGCVEVLAPEDTLAAVEDSGPDSKVIFFL